MEPLSGERARDDDTESSLTQYFRDLSAISRPMTWAEERALARRLDEASVLVWERLLAHPALVAELANRVEQAFPAAGAAVARAAARARTTATLTRAVRRAARELRKLDRDRLLFGKLLALVEGKVSERKAPSRYLTGVREALAGVDEVRREFVKRNLRLVVSVARRYRNSGLGLADLIQEGNIGLLKAVDRYESARGFRFSTYATWWIRHHVARAIADRGRLVREPVHRRDTRAQLHRAQRQLLGVLGRPPTLAELAKATGQSVHRVEQNLQSAFEQRCALDHPRQPDDSRALHDVLADPDAPELPPDALARRAAHRQLDEALGRLRPLEMAVLRARFGLDSEGDERTLADIGREHRLSRERIRQIQAEAMGKLRRSLEKAR